MTFRFTLAWGRSLPGSSCWVSCCLTVLYHSPWLFLFQGESAACVVCVTEGSSLECGPAMEWVPVDSTTVSTIFFLLGINPEAHLEGEWGGARASSPTQHVSRDVLEAGGEQGA